MQGEWVCKGMGVRGENRCKGASVEGEQECKWSQCARERGHEGNTGAKGVSVQME